MTTFVDVLQASHLTTDLPDIATDWMQQPFLGFELDSRKITAGQVFIALAGEHSTLEDNRRYIQQALAQGALGVVTEIAELAGAQVVYMAQLRQQLGSLQQAFLQAQHAQALARVVAVTGTNGKTTVARLTAELLDLLNQPTAVMGTTGNGILPKLQPSSHTTLDALHLQQMYYTFSQQGARFLSLEASSHGLVQGRLAGLPIEVAAFTNLTRDHLDYHKTMQNYAKAKAILFGFNSLKHAVIHADADYAQTMLEAVARNPNHPHAWQYSSIRHDVDYWVSDIQFGLGGATFTLHSPAGAYAVNSPLLGRFNIDNLLAAVISVEKLGFALAEIVSKIPQLQGAAGRMQCIADEKRQCLFIVDYAHTPDALHQVLCSLRHHVTGHLAVVFGCGGERDRGKRPIMTQIAVDEADQVILTLDNPRNEDQDQIFADMRQGVDFKNKSVIEIRARREAIKTAVQRAQTGDIVVIAGKGHENYQDKEGFHHWFDDVVEVKSALANLGYQPHSYPA